MAIPDFQSFFKPLLDISSDGQEHSLKEARKIIAENMELTEDDLEELLPSGTQRKFDNRVAWAKSYFVQAKVLESPRRAFFRITDRGRELLKQNHNRIDIRILNQYPEFLLQLCSFQHIVGKVPAFFFGSFNILNSVCQSVQD